MPRYKGAHLTWNDRLTIEKMLREGYSKPQIARYLGVHHSTIYDECRRGAVELKRSDLTTYISYSADVAKDYHLERKRNMEKPLKIGKDLRLARWLVATISDGYSPSAACSMMGKTPETTFSCTLCRQTVYKYIENGYLWPLTNKALRYKKDEKRTYNRVKAAAKAPRGDSIERRPAYINDRQEPGHWEMDSVVGVKGTKAALLVLTERVTRFEIIIKMRDDTAASVVRALDRLERKLGTATFREIFKSITVDNGSEFADCKGMEASCKAPGEARTHIYYCHPRSPGERGSNEKQNQLIRWFFPKGTDFRKVQAKKVRQVQDWINNYPRLILDWHTSAELFSVFLASV